jgi:hypothetical protein
MADQSKPIGILFVHGIGAEKQGETLLGYSEPVFNWIARWLSASNGTTATGNRPAQSIEVIETNLYPKNGEPAHSHWVMHLRDGKNKLQKTDWIAAECWWAETIAPSNWRQTIDWAMKVVPSIVFFQLSNFVGRVFDRQEREFLAPILALFFTLPYAAFGFLLLVLLNIAAFLLGILAMFQTILPGGMLRSFIQSIQVIVSQWAGDIFLLLNSPIQRSAMVSKVKQDLAWMKKNCSQVVVVAHSQGAAISYQVLQEDHSSQIRGFVTLGSAIKLLKKVESLQESGIHKRFVRVFYGSALFVIASLLFFLKSLVFFFLSPGAAGTNPPGFDWMNLLISATPFVIVISWLILVVQWLDPDPDRSWDPIQGERSIARKGFRWCDLYASNDPAPDGRFSRNLPAFLQSSQVYNRANLLLDHTTYWQNLDEFVSAVVVFLSEVTNTKFLNLTDRGAAYIAAAKARRRRRFGWLIWSRTLALASAIALLGSLRHELPRVATGILWMVNGMLGLLSSNISIRLDQPAAQSILGGIVVISVPLVWHLIIGQILRWWQEKDFAKLFRREVDNSGLLPLRAVASMMGILLFGTAGSILETHGKVLTNLEPAYTPIYGLAFATLVILISILFARLLPVDITSQSDMKVWSPSMLGINTMAQDETQPREESTQRPVSLTGLVDVAWASAPVLLTAFPFLLLWAPALTKAWTPFLMTLMATLLAWWNLLAFLQARRSSGRRKVYLIAIGLNTVAYVIWLLIWLRR